jgi:hypothetical protein
MSIRNRTSSTETKKKNNRVNQKQIKSQTKRVLPPKMISQSQPAATYTARRKYALAKNKTPKLASYLTDTLLHKCRKWLR